MSHVSRSLWTACGNKADYDANGDLTRQTKTCADGTTVVFDGSGRATAVEEPNGQTREFTYDDDGDLMEIRGHLGTWKRTVDENGIAVWVNQDTRQTWKGHFRADSNGHLHFTPHQAQGLRIRPRRT